MSSTQDSQQSTGQENIEYLYYNFKKPIILTQENSNKISLSSLESSINTLKSSYNSLNIKLYKMNSFVNYKQPLKNIEKHRKLDYYTLIKSLYQNLKNSIPSEKNLSPNLINSDEIKITLNFANMDIIIDHILIWLNNVLAVSSGSSKNKINAFFESHKKFDQETKEESKEEITWSSLDTTDHKVTDFLDSLGQFNSIEIKLNQGLETINSASVNLDRMLLFYLFFDKIFPELLNVKWDLNIPKLNQKYTTLSGIKQLYSNKPNFIENTSIPFHKFFICNLLLNKKIYSRKNLHLSLTQYDGYIIEISNLLLNEIKFNNNFTKEIINQKYNSNFLMTSSIFELSIKFNSLDDLLFQNFLFLLYQNLIFDKTIIKIDVNLFPENAFININQRKILTNFLFKPKIMNDLIEPELNNCNYEKSYNFKYHNDYNWNNEDKSTYISDDAVLDLLCLNFQINLMLLIYILEKNTSIISIDIKANLPFILKSKENYTMSLIYFFHNFFKVLIHQKNLLQFATIILETNIEVPLNSIETDHLVKLDNVNVHTLMLHLKNSSRLIDYCHLPFNYIDYLCLGNMNFNDLRNLINAMKNAEHVSLQHLKLEFDYVDNVEINSIKELCKFCFFETIRVFWMNFYNEFPQIKYNEFITTIIKAINYCQKTRINFESVFTIFIDINEMHLYTSSYYRSLITEHLGITDEWNPEIYFYYEDYSFEKKENAITISLKINKWEKSNDKIKDTVQKLSSEINLSESNNIMQNTGSILKCLFKPTSMIQLKFILQVTEE